MELRETECGGMYWTDLPWRALVNMVMLILYISMYVYIHVYFQLK
jgi:hypothetical protein